MNGSGKMWRRAAIGVAVIGLLTGGLVLGLSQKSRAADVEPPASPTPSVALGASHERDEHLRLYQLLFDYHFHEPLSSLGQKVRILIWLRYLDFSETQKQQLLYLARKFAERRQAVAQEEDAITRRYEQELEPLYQQVYDAIKVTKPDESTLETLARQIQGVNLAFKREDELQTLRIGAVRAVLSDQRDFLQTLGPEQEDKLVTSLFFLRKEIDPFANPGDYRAIIGPTWNAGDFSSLLKQKSRKESHLNIGGLWGMTGTSGEEKDFSNIQRPIVLFFILKEPTLVATLEENLAGSR